jgi:hypothetical protein
MKRLLLGLFLTAGLTANAQLPNGSIAPDFTATDINGVEHTLSEYLAAGKTVIIDISATWCGPCWQYHGTHALEDTYYSYGEGGSNEIVVLFIEGDPGTSVSSLYGTNVPGDNGTTQGNWTVGSPYPIIDDGDGSIADAYQIAFFPTVYRICPNGTTTLYNSAPSRATIKNTVESGCGVTLAGATNHALTTTTDVRTCGTTGVATATLKNYGTNVITAGTVELKQGNTVLNTKNITNNINAFSSSTVTFDEVELNPDLEYTVQVSALNGAAPSFPAAAVANFGVISALTGNNNITVNIYTDNYPSEISWAIKDSEGAVVANGGPYQAGNADQWGGGGPDANTTKTHEVTLPGTSLDCYTVELYDSYGDGWSLGSTFHGADIWSGSTQVFAKQVYNFGTSSVTPSAFKASGTLDNNVLTAHTFAMYPNPTTGILNFSTEEAVSVSIVDITGKTVFTAANINNGDTINLSSLQKGMYIAQIKGENTQKTEKLIIN